MNEDNDVIVDLENSHSIMKKDLKKHFKGKKSWFDTFFKKAKYRIKFMETSWKKKWKQ